MSQAVIPYDPRLVTPYRPEATDRLLYDGDCGLCHRAVTFILEHDRSQSSFVFSPLRSEPAAKSLPAGMTLDDLPDSIVIVSEEGEVYTRSSAIIYIGMRLGGLYRLGATLGRVVPKPLRDAAYDFIATIRHRFFAKPKEACPMLPKELRSRFEF